MNYLLSTFMKLPKTYCANKKYIPRAFLSLPLLIFLGFIGMMTLSSNAIEDTTGDIEKQRNSLECSQVPLDKSSQSDEEEDSSQDAAFYEDLAFCCGKSVSCYYSDDLFRQRNSNEQWVDTPISNHECHYCVRHTCIWGTLGCFVVNTALLIGGSISYAPGCSDCCFPQSWSGAYTSCTPDCRLPFMSTVGSMDLGTVLPSCSTYSCYFCAGCNKKRQFQRKFKEGQSCLPEHRFSLRNLYWLLSQNPLVNFCCGPTEGDSHTS